MRPDTPPWLSIIIPARNEASQIRATLSHLKPLRQRGVEVILADGGSRDGTAGLAAGRVDRVLISPVGRARQMNAGAQVARGEWLLFLHADTMLPADADTLIRQADGCGKVWGRFDMRLSGASLPFRVIETLMNWRSRLTAIATGDQALFVRRDVFEAVGGFADIALMEDIALSRTLKQRSRPACLQARVVSSSRRWEQNGIIPTILIMWRLRWLYYRGANPEDLARRYHNATTDDGPHHD
jgi:rSAM/selenodomain-associated transferase 2